MITIQEHCYYYIMIFTWKFIHTLKNLNFFLEYLGIYLIWLISCNINLWCTHRSFAKKIVDEFYYSKQQPRLHVWVSKLIPLSKMEEFLFGTCNWMADSWLLLSTVKLESNWFILFCILLGFYITLLPPGFIVVNAWEKKTFIPFIKCSHYKDRRK